MTWNDLKTWKLPEPSRCGLEGPSTRRVDDADDVVALLRAFAARPGVVGWLAEPAGVRLVEGAADVPDGPVLDAEVAAGSSSLAVRHLGDSWLVTELERVAGDSHWVLSETYAAVAPGATVGPSGSVTYEVFWAREAVDMETPEAWSRPVVAAASRFVGFGGEPS